MPKLAISSVLMCMSLLASAEQTQGATLLPPKPAKTLPAAAPILPPAPSSRPQDFADEIGSSSITPAEIRKLKEMRDQANRAFSESVSPPAKASVGMIFVDLSPGVTPPAIRLSSSQGATLVFLDSGGSPWPVVNHVNFSPNLVAINRPIDGGHVLTLEPKQPHGAGNITVFLRDLPTPITLTVLGGQREVDYRVDIRIPKKISGKDDSPADAGAIQFLDPIMSDVLSNTVSPSDGTPIAVKSRGINAWIRTGKTKTTKTMLIRLADGVILSPSPIYGKKATASDGTKAYETAISPVITILRNGKAENIVLQVE